MRALSVSVKPVDQGRAWRHDKDVADCLTDLGAGPIGHAVLTVIRLQNARKLPECGTLAWEKFIGPAGAGDAVGGPGGEG